MLTSTLLVAALLPSILSILLGRGGRSPAVAALGRAVLLLLAVWGGRLNRESGEEKEERLRPRGVTNREREKEGRGSKVSGHPTAAHRRSTRTLLSRRGTVLLLLVLTVATSCLWGWCSIASATGRGVGRTVRLEGNGQSGARGGQAARWRLAGI